MISKTFFKTPQGQIARVTFTLPESLWADTICLVGETLYTLGNSDQPLGWFTWLVPTHS